MARFPSLALALALTACARDRSDADSVRGNDAPERMVRAEEARSESRASGSGKGRGRGRWGGEAPVVVDGRMRGVLRYRELPSSLATTWHVLDDGRRVQRFALGPYLRALGVSLERVSALHLHGGDGRVSVIEGEELRRVGDRLQIHFTGETSGRPTFKYPGVALRANTTIDGIHALAVYVETPAPALAHGKRVVADASVDDSIRAARDAARGTRIYRDGVLLTTLRRRDLRDGEPRSMAATLATLGVSLEQVRNVALVSDGDAPRTYGPADLEALAVTAPRGSHGRLALDAQTEIDAVLLHARTSPAPRRDVAPTKAATLSLGAASASRLAKLELAPQETP